MFSLSLIDTIMGSPTPSKSITKALRLEGLLSILSQSIGNSTTNVLFTDKDTTKEKAVEKAVVRRSKRRNLSGGSTTNGMFSCYSKTLR